VLEWAPQPLPGNHPMVPAPQRRVNLGPDATQRLGMMSGLVYPRLVPTGCRAERLGCLDHAKILTMGGRAGRASVRPPAAFGTKPGTTAEDTQGYMNPEFQPRRMTGKGIGNSGHATVPTVPTVPKPLPTESHTQRHPPAATPLARK
jgi:hypothetical protein